MKYLLLLILSFPSLAAPVAVVQSGEEITSARVNELVTQINLLNSQIKDLKNKVLPVGTIVSSFLTLSQQRNQNGDCWNLMDGRQSHPAQN